MGTGLSEGGKKLTLDTFYYFLMFFFSLLIQVLLLSLFELPTFPVSMYSKQVCRSTPPDSIKAVFKRQTKAMFLPRFQRFNVNLLRWEIDLGCS